MILSIKNILDLNKDYYLDDDKLKPMEIILHEKVPNFSDEDLPYAIFYDDKEYHDFEFSRLETTIIHADNLPDIYKKDFGDYKDYILTNIFLDHDYPEKYFELVNYFTTEKCKIAKIKFNSNKEIMINFDIIARVTRSEDNLGESKISFITFDTKEGK